MNEQIHLVTYENDSGETLYLESHDHEEQESNISMRGSSKFRFSKFIVHAKIFVTQDDAENALKACDGLLSHRVSIQCFNAEED